MKPTFKVKYWFIGEFVDRLRVPVDLSAKRYVGFGRDQHDITCIYLTFVL